MSTFSDGQLIVSTADEEFNYFRIVFSDYPKDEFLTIPPGQYRIIDGQLYRIVPGVSPHLTIKNKD